MENRHISSLGDVDVHKVVRAGNEIVPFQSPAELVGLNADDGIDRLVEVLLPPEHLGGHCVTLYFQTSSGKGLCDDKL